MIKWKKEKKLREKNNCKGFNYNFDSNFIVLKKTIKKETNINNDRKK